MKSDGDAENTKGKQTASTSSAHHDDEAATKDTSPAMERGPGKEGDLIIRDGFPALYIPKKKSAPGDEKIKVGPSFQPMVNGEEPLPRHEFWSSEDVIQFDNDQGSLNTLREDCATVFSARDKPDGASYSAGETFFIPSNMKPRCALEALALKIFHEHTKDLEPGTFNPAQSGANWWTLVMDDNAEEKTASATACAKTIGLDCEDEDEEDDEVGLHFDADYELEEQTGNILLHPRVATVTYLSDHGAPTLVLEQKSPPMDDLKKQTLERGISKAWLCHPRLGKHTAFDGRYGFKKGCSSVFNVLYTLFLNNHVFGTDLLTFISDFYMERLRYTSPPLKTTHLSMTKQRSPRPSDKKLFAIQSGTHFSLMFG